MIDLSDLQAARTASRDPDEIDRINNEIRRRVREDVLSRPPDPGRLSNVRGALAAYVEEHESVETGEALMATLDLLVRDASVLTDDLPSGANPPIENPSFESSDEGWTT